MIDYLTPLHFIYGFGCSIIFAEILYSSKIINNKTKAIFYGSALTFSLGLLKEANDLYQIFSFNGTPDITDIIINSVGIGAGFFTEDIRINNGINTKKFVKNIEHIIEASYRKMKS